MENKNDEKEDLEKIQLTEEEFERLKDFIKLLYKMDKEIRERESISVRNKQLADYDFFISNVD